jgi:hypothetical protein
MNQEWLRAQLQGSDARHYTQVRHHTEVESTSPCHRNTSYGRFKTTMAVNSKRGIAHGSILVSQGKPWCALLEETNL